MRVTKIVRKPRDSERALYVEGSLGKASNCAKGVCVMSSSLSKRDGVVDLLEGAMSDIVESQQTASIGRGQRVRPGF
jgi:hypothetical protein